MLKHRYLRFLFLKSIQAIDGKIFFAEFLHEFTEFYFYFLISYGKSVFYVLLLEPEYTIPAKKNIRLLAHNRSLVTRLYKPNG